MDHKNFTEKEIDYYTQKSKRISKKIISTRNELLSIFTKKEISFIKDTLNKSAVYPDLSCKEILYKILSEISESGFGTQDIERELLLNKVKKLTNYQAFLLVFFHK
ncbi:hypothetical protein SAMN05421676_10244 [Salinibacillus kushneri]|uniref:Uncharacterized protein n=1 Tax=Salinibacillus kushneri TaxID=237682 RepID=A0A1I0A844_9BACI|nr:hypothetical protein [Salinibacillus kushneri]SES89411.1 hypothetical protein SAMN05421676_10244 [Salinibacillus kushneri]